MIFIILFIVIPHIILCLYMMFGNPSKEFINSISNYHPPGHE